MRVRDDPNSHKTRLVGPRVSLRTVIILFDIFFWDIVFRHFFGYHFRFVGVWRIFHAAYYFRLERLPLFQQFLHAFGVRFRHARESLRIPRLASGTGSKPWLVQRNQLRVPCASADSPCRPLGRRFALRRRSFFARSLLLRNGLPLCASAFYRSLLGLNFFRLLFFECHVRFSFATALLYHRTACEPHQDQGTAKTCQRYYNAFKQLSQLSSALASAGGSSP